MTDFLILLGKLNFVIGAAIIAVYLLRLPFRAAFHTQIAYGLWLLVPVAALASLLPPRMAIQGTLAPIQLLIDGDAVMPKLPTPQDIPPDWTWLVFGAWTLGAAMMLLYLMRLQRGFNRAERVGMAGPAVAGFVRPRIVMPSDFLSRFNASEQAAILAHEQAHLARQDVRVNAVVALLRCICWFNPLVHMASTWMRRDQELACDAVALRSVPRLDYANTLFKAQIHVVTTSLGCAWPGSEHPLTERIALLSHEQPVAARRFIGLALLIFITGMGGLSAGAAQFNSTQSDPMRPDVDTTETGTTEGISDRFVGGGYAGSGSSITADHRRIGIRFFADNSPEYSKKVNSYDGNVLVELGDLQHSASVRADTVTVEVVSITPRDRGNVLRLIADGNVVLTRDNKSVRVGHLEAKVINNARGSALVSGDLSLSP